MPRPALAGANLLAVGRRLQLSRLAVRGLDGVVGLGGAGLVHVLGRLVDVVGAFPRAQALADAAEQRLFQAELLPGRGRVEGSAGGPAGCGRG
jgi:hypothetical protein